MQPTGEPSQLRVLHVINQLTGGGAERSLVSNAMATKTEIDQAIVVLRPGSPRDDLHDVGVPIYEPGPGEALGRIAAVRHVRRAIRAFDPDIVHTSLFEADLAGRIAGWVERRRVLTSVVNTAYGESAREAERVPAWKLEVVRMIDLALHGVATSAVHAISNAAAEHAVEHLRITPQRIRVVPRGRATALLGQPGPSRRDRVRREQGWGVRPIIVNVARQEPQKGQQTLLKAFAALRGEHPDALLLIVGREGRSTTELLLTVSAHGLDGSVRFLGARDDVADLVAAADCFAFPSRYEGLGGAVIEACALAIPTVASDLPAIREVLGEEHPWLVPSGDVDALVAAMHAVLSEPLAAAEVGARQRRRFLENFEIGAVGSQMVLLYQDLADRTVLRGGRLRRVPTLRSWS